MTKEEVVRRLRDAKGKRKEICRRADVGYRWANHMLAGKIADPGVGKIDRLRAYFLSNP